MAKARVSFSEQNPHAHHTVSAMSYRDPSVWFRIRAWAVTVDEAAEGRHDISVSFVIVFLAVLIFHTFYIYARPGAMNAKFVVRKTLYNPIPDVLPAVFIVVLDATVVVVELNLCHCNLILGRSLSDGVRGDPKEGEYVGEPHCSK